MQNKWEQNPSKLVKKFQFKDFEEALKFINSVGNLFSEALKEIKQGIKNDVLYTYAFSSPKNAILAEFEIVKPLLGLSEEEALIYEKKRIYLEETSESGLHNYGR